MPTKIKKRHKFNMQGVPAHIAAALKLVYEGALLLDKGDAERAERTWRSAVNIDPHCYSAWRFLTELLCNQKRKSDAAACLKQLIATSPKTSEDLFAFADKSFFLEEFIQSRTLVQEALRLNPSPELRIKLVLLSMKLDFAEKDYQAVIKGATQILEMPPSDVTNEQRLEALKHRLRCYNILSYVRESIPDCREMLSLEPGARLHRHLLFHLNYLPDTTPEMLFEESVRFNSTYVTPNVGEISPHTNDPDPDRKLRIGYISPDFRNHAIIKLLPVVLEHHDPAQVEVFAYSIDTKDDLLTNYVRSWVKNFVELPSSAEPERVGLNAVEEDDSIAASDAAGVRAIADRIRADGIDILIDLASHTMPLGAFQALALKPAPVQVTWMGVMATTGLPTMDYFLGNAEIPPPGTEDTFTERIYRLPNAHACYRPTNDRLEIAPSPYFSNQYLTFGCFNSPKKITREMVQVWSLILHLHPGSKMFLKYKDLDQEYAQFHLRKWFTDDGIAPDRLLFEGISLASKYLPTWNMVDIALDPFPYNGGTTTYDALWMGVPVVTMGGRLTVSCGSCIVSELGMPVAKTLQQYVAIACGLAKAIPTELGLRKRVRQAMKDSRIMDEPRLARELEAAYREMWQTWCANQAGSAQDC